MKAAIRRAIQIREEEGMLTLVPRAIGYSYRKSVRRILPTVGYRTRGSTIHHGEIKIGRKRKLFDKYLPSNFHGVPHDPLKEAALLLGQSSLTRRGDRVVIVGGGGGKSAVAAAQQVGAEGQVTIYDGRTGEDHKHFGVENIEANLELNGVADRSEVHHAIVSTREAIEQSNDVDHNHEDTPTVAPDDLPECDVLEFDCNGAELSILRNLSIRPRLLLIEIEAPFYKTVYGGDEHPRMVLSALSDLGYTVVQRMGHRGTPISEEELHQLLDAGFERGISDGFHVETQSGAINSPVVFALRTDES